MDITGAALFVKALKAEQVDTLFAYPGGQVIDLFDALYGEPDIELILPRHEQGLVHAADGYARSTGKVGVCLVTSGPGAANLVTGIATANYDCVPLVCFTEQVPTSLIGKDAFQEVNIADITRTICKYSVTVCRREDLAPAIWNAFRIARTGKPGVAVVDLPKDIQQAYGSDEYPAKAANDKQKPVFSKHTGITENVPDLHNQKEQIGKRPDTPRYSAQIESAWNALRRAKRPLFLAGGGVRVSCAGAEIQRFAEITGVPVVTTIMGKGTIPSTHALYIGNIGIHGSYAANTAVSRCDLLFSIGTRFNDRITGKIDTFASHAAIVHIDIDPACISKNIPADIPIIADAKTTVLALLEKAQPLQTQTWLDQIRIWKEQHPLSMKGTGMTPEKILQAINRIYDRVIIATDVGQNQLWATQFLELNEQKQLLTSGGLGTMGYGLPAAIGAKIGNPETDVVVISGDGGIQMNIQELATAVCCELPVTICIFNNGYLGNVRQWQEIFYGGRYSQTCMRYRRSCGEHCPGRHTPFAKCYPANGSILEKWHSENEVALAAHHPERSNPGTKYCPEYIPDFVRLAESYGAKGIRVTREEEIESALKTAKNTLKIPVIIEFIIEREENVMPIVPPGNTLEDMLLFYNGSET